MFDVKQNKAICILPWVHEYKNITGQSAPCCHADKYKNNQTVDYVRDSMLKGIQPDVCSNCYKSEKESNWSYRIRETNDWIKKFGTPDIDNPKIQFADIRYNPTCNLKCKTCNAEESIFSEV